MLASVLAIHKQERTAVIGIKAQMLSHPFAQHIAAQRGAFEHIQNTQCLGFAAHGGQVLAAGQRVRVYAQRPQVLNQRRRLEPRRQVKP